MTDPSRIQAIQPVHNAEMYAVKKREDLCGGQYTDEQIAFKVAMVSPRSLADIGAPEMAKDRIRWLSTQLSIARSQAKEDAALMRRSSESVHYWQINWDADEGAFICGDCQGGCPNPAHPNRREIPSVDDFQHTSDCIITKLRTAADRVEGEL